MVSIAGDSSELDECAAAIDAVGGAFIDAWMAPHNGPDVPVPATQLRVLFIVGHRDGINLSGLAAELGALLSSASRLCDRLEAAGLIVRDPGQQSRREINIRLSLDGEALLDKVRRHRQRELLRILTEMPAPARSALLAGLTQFRDAATGRPADGSAESFSMPA
jgi:DNA-binding MarR family transcriptional regulator